jgi:hypothetical protein
VKPSSTAILADEVMYLDCIGMDLQVCNLQVMYLACILAGPCKNAVREKKRKNVALI